MCLAIPYQILELAENGYGIIEIGSMCQEVALSLIPEAKVGDWVLVYCGIVTTRIEEAEAKEILRLFEEISEYDLI